MFEILVMFVAIVALWYGLIFLAVLLLNFINGSARR